MIEAISKISSKRQITLPASLCKELDLTIGDKICFDFDMKSKVAVVRKATPYDIQWYMELSKTLTEWEGDEDDDL